MLYQAFTNKWYALWELVRNHTNDQLEFPGQTMVMVEFLCYNMLMPNQQPSEEPNTPDIVKSVREKREHDDQFIHSLSEQLVSTVSQVMKRSVEQMPEADQEPTDDFGQLQSDALSTLHAVLEAEKQIEQRQGTLMRLTNKRERLTAKNAKNQEELAELRSKMLAWLQDCTRKAVLKLLIERDKNRLPAMKRSQNIEANQLEILQEKAEELDKTLRARPEALFQISCERIQNQYNTVKEILLSPEAKKIFDEHFFETILLPKIDQAVQKNDIDSENTDELKKLLHDHMHDGYMHFLDAPYSDKEMRQRVEKRQYRINEISGYDAVGLRTLTNYSQNFQSILSRILTMLLRQKRARSVAKIHEQLCGKSTRDYSVTAERLKIPRELEPLDHMPSSECKNLEGVEFWHIFREHPLITAIASQDEIRSMERVLIRKACEADLFPGGRESSSGTRIAYDLGTLNNPDVIPPFMEHIRQHGSGHTSAAVVLTLKKVLEKADPKRIDETVTAMDEMNQGVVRLMRDPHSTLNTMDNDSGGYAACRFIQEAARTIRREEHLAVLKDQLADEPKVLQSFFQEYMEPEDLEKCIHILAEKTDASVAEITEFYFNIFAHKIYPGGDVVPVIQRVARLLGSSTREIFDRVKDSFHLGQSGIRNTVQYVDSLLKIAKACNIDVSIIGREYFDDAIQSLSLEDSDQVVTVLIRMNGMRGEPMNATIEAALTLIEQRNYFSNPIAVLDTLEAVSNLTSSEEINGGFPAMTERFFTDLTKYIHPHHPDTGPMLLKKLASATGNNCADIYERLKERWESYSVRDIQSFMVACTRTAKLIGVPEADQLKKYESSVILAVQNTSDFEHLAAYEAKIGAKKHSLLKKMAKKCRDDFVKIGTKTEWQAIVGEPLAAFLDALPKRTDEKRNAFTHNPYDRTTKFVQLMFRGQEDMGVDAESITLLTEYISRFGLSRTPIIFEYYRNIQLLEARQRDELPNEQQKTGIATLDDLEKKFNDIRRRMYAHEPITDVSKLSAFEIDVLRCASGKSTHSFDGGRPELERMIGDFSHNMDKGNILSLPHEYTATTIRAHDVRMDFDPVELTKAMQPIAADVLRAIDTQDNWQSLRDAAMDCCAKGLQELAPKRQTNTFIEQEYVQWETTINALEAADSIDAAVAAIVEVSLKKARNTGLLSVLRQMIMHKAFEHGYSGDALQELQARAQEGASPQAALSITALISNNIQDHVLNMNDQNKEKYWSEKAWKKITGMDNRKSMIHCSTLFEPEASELARVVEKFKAVSLDTSRDIEVIPDRGFVGEMASYLANACFSKVYPLLQWQPQSYREQDKTMPPLVPYKFIQKTDDNIGEFAGSALLFELEDTENKSVLLVRPFNCPEEAGMDIEQFIESTFDHFANIAKKRGCTKLIIPGIGGAQSNYPQTYGYLQRTYCKEKNHISLSNRFDFNGYNITNNCYIVRDLE